ncbi:hypothetical protein [Streptomyces celluloflavus]|uniref:hypothetical protein n=1 Tax=Streptomyces celluloflavus TaxID=58344 RepID=UPI00167CCBB2
MSGAHAKPPRPPLIQLAVRRPITALALLGTGGPAAIVISTHDARNAPAPASVPDAGPEIAVAERSSDGQANSEVR